MSDAVTKIVVRITAVNDRGQCQNGTVLQIPVQMVDDAAHDQALAFKLLKAVESVRSKSRGE